MITDVMTGLYLWNHFNVGSIMSEIISVHGEWILVVNFVPN